MSQTRDDPWLGFRIVDVDLNDELRGRVIERRLANMGIPRYMRPSIL
jgi:hypothetical protein